MANIALHCSQPPLREETMSIKLAPNKIPSMHQWNFSELTTTAEDARNVYYLFCGR
ncbi:hypothetical protein JVX96_20935 [Variovorax sp. PDNC026]|uniref:hypothetical protein n=1 Tax=Variovorax sp. PDNC026 TaxID=2811425 RepID=UPI001965D701|nr:hypothetical protein [Variovorax sp. PDNC026]QRY30537.1 hypothetical protein JVX96_20935 [Variovorax sp. PDNC026]